MAGFFSIPTSLPGPTTLDPAWHNQENGMSETKKKVADLVTKAICEGCGATPDEVSIIFQDIKMSDWADNRKLNSVT